MFDDLLASLQNTIKQAKSTTASLNKQLKQSRIQLNNCDNYFHDPTHTLGKAVSFPKSQRFKPLQKQQPRTTDSFYDSNSMPLQQAQAKGTTFAKSERFIEQKQDQLTLINPNFDVVKKNNKQAPKIVPLSKNQLGKSRMSQATAASQSQIGPGKYFVNQEKTPNVKAPTFVKANRFEKSKNKYQDTPLFISDAQTKKRPPSMAILKKKIQKNRKQISNQQQQQLRQRVKFIYWKTIPLELDRLLKKHAGAPILKQKYFDLKKLKGSQRKCAILMLLDRLNYQRGGFENKIQKQLDARCGVVYRKSTPKPFKFSQMQPGPDFYYPQDDLIRPTTIGFTFAKKQQKVQKQSDNRDYQINQQYFKKGGNIIIMPEHKIHTLTQQQIRSLNRGPGFYDCLFSQVQKRDDIGVVKFQQITQKNARQNNCIQIPQVNDAMYFPNYTAIDPKVQGPIYKEPANVKPMHTPQKLLFPEHWLFYDGDLNKVKAEVAKNVLIGNGLDFKQYQQFARKLKTFKKYMQLRKQQVEQLQYEPKYDIIDPHIEGFDMAKKPEKTLIQPIVKPQFEVDGDNLILQPQKLKKKLADIQFHKMMGRDENQIGPDDVIEGDVLLIEPKKPKKHIAEVNFQKMVSRPQINNEKNEDDEPAEGDRILIDPKVPQRKLPNIDFSKQVARQGAETLNQMRQEKQQLIISPEKPKRIKGFVNMQRMTSVRLVPFLRKKKQQKASVISLSKQKKSQQNNFILDEENNQQN